MTNLDTSTSSIEDNEEALINKDKIDPVIRMAQRWLDMNHITIIEDNIDLVIRMVQRWLDLNHITTKLLAKELLVVLSKLEDECKGWRSPVADVHYTMLSAVSLVEALLQVLRDVFPVGMQISGDPLLSKDADTLIQCLTSLRRLMKNVSQRMTPQTRKLKLDPSSHPLEYTSTEALGVGSYGLVLEAKWMGLTIAVKQFPVGSGAILNYELEVFRRTSHINIMRMLGYIPELKEDNPESNETERKACLLMERMVGNLDTFIDDAVEQLKTRDTDSTTPTIYDSFGGDHSQPQGSKGGSLEISMDDFPMHVHLNTPLAADLGICIEILLQIATGMAYLHEEHIIHRDLKPGNILLNKWPPRTTTEHFGISDFTVKISDFGTARLDFASKCGTGYYRAPEVRSGVLPSKKVDVYSFGGVCYKVCTGRDPSSEPQELVQELVPSQSCPLAMIYLIKRCWDSEPYKRPDFCDICKFLGFFKAKILLTATSHKGGPMCLLYPGIKHELVEEMVHLLGRPWLYKEATSQLELTSCCICYEGRRILNQVMQALPNKHQHRINRSIGSLQQLWEMKITKDTVGIAVHFWMGTTFSFVFLVMHKTLRSSGFYYFVFLVLSSSVFSAAVLILACFSVYIWMVGVELFFASLWQLQKFSFGVVFSMPAFWACFLFFQRFQLSFNPLLETLAASKDQLRSSVFIAGILSLFLFKLL